MIVKTIGLFTQGRFVLQGHAKWARCGKINTVKSKLLTNNPTYAHTTGTIRVIPTKG